MSFLSTPGVLIPANIPPAEKPFGDVIVPFGTDAIGSVMAIIEVTRKVDCERAQHLTVITN